MLLVRTIDKLDSVNYLVFALHFQPIWGARLSKCLVSYLWRIVIYC